MRFSTSAAAAAVAMLAGRAAADCVIGESSQPWEIEACVPGLIQGTWTCGQSRATIAQVGNTFHVHGGTGPDPSYINVHCADTRDIIFMTCTPGSWGQFDLPCNTEIRVAGYNLVHSSIGN
ncbi:hypothetical protein E4U54_006142 [Claviceps lovelessii]|nr:hypothetical protein E4U54_006142 [Claviceps lovelessii]